MSGVPDDIGGIDWGEDHWAPATRARLEDLHHHAGAKGLGIADVGWTEPGGAHLEGWSLYRLSDQTREPEWRQLRSLDDVERVIESL